jgi:hypothetical protein
MEELKVITERDRESDEAVFSEQGLDAGSLQGVALSSQAKRNPPARNTSRFWFERFLAVIQRQNPSIIDNSFLSQIAPSNEGKLLAQLKFLRVIDDRGKPTPLLPMLNMVGDDQKRAFLETARDSYADLFAELKLDKAVPDDLVNFFIRKYGFTRDKAANAAKFFLYLVEKGGMTVSPELSAFLTEKNGVKPAERIAKPSVVREARTYVQNIPRTGARKSGSRFETNSALQATIEIKLDKDTPREYWDRVLALLGEKKDEDSSSQTEQSNEIT